MPSSTDSTRQPCSPNQDTQFRAGTGDQDDRHVRIVVVGAGPSGLCFAYKAQRLLKNFSLTIYEKNPEVAGTWYENRYPGCMSDIPSVNYTFSFEPKSDWSSPYAKACEIRQYLGDFCGRYGLDQYIKVKHKVRAAKWMNNESQWSIDVEDIQTKMVFSQACDIFINAGGYLNSPKYPDIPGFDLYQGKLLHSAAWDPDFDPQGKRVALIGNGASGTQILPALQPLVSHVLFILRTPTWLLPPITSPSHTYTPSELTQLSNPSTSHALRLHNEAIINKYFTRYILGSAEQTQKLSEYNQSLRAFLPSHLPSETLLPSCGDNCNRLLPGPNYITSLSASNVTCVYGSATSLTPTGLIDSSGTEHKALDAIILATGFDTSSVPRFHMIGLDGINMQDTWRSQPRSYLGVAADGFSNFFTLLGPYSPVANGTVLPALEAQCEFVVGMVGRWQDMGRGRVKYFVPKKEAVDGFLEHQGRFFEEREWLGRWRPQNGRFIWPGTTLHYLETLGKVGMEDWEVVYEGHRFAWLGDGVSGVERDPEGDLVWYLRHDHQSKFLGKETSESPDRGDNKNHASSKSGMKLGGDSAQKA